MAGACLLDLTRLVSRLPDRTLTGVDRVELAWLADRLGAAAPLWVLVRTRFGFLLLDRTGAQGLMDRLQGRVPWGPLDLLGRLSRRGSVAHRRVLADLRRLALARSVHRRLWAMLRRHVPQGTPCINLGHTTLRADLLGQVRRAGLPVVAMVHDTIPLTHPHLSRAGTVGPFLTKMEVLCRHADLLIHTAAATRATTEAVLASLGPVPPGVVAPLGVSVPDPAPQDLPATLADMTRFFLSVGTLEPRKRQMMLLDLWEDLAKDPEVPCLPTLVLAGSRGWLSEAEFARLEASPLYGTTVLEVPGLSDGALAALYTRADALLMPSVVEGYGLPPLEAAALGCPVVLTDLPVYRETLGSFPIYVESDDMYLWRTVVKQMIAGPPAHRQQTTIVPPEWSQHVATVLQAVEAGRTTDAGVRGRADWD